MGRWTGCPPGREGRAFLSVGEAAVLPAVFEVNVEGLKARETDAGVSELSDPGDGVWLGLLLGEGNIPEVDDVAWHGQERRMASSWENLRLRESTCRRMEARVGPRRYMFISPVESRYLWSFGFPGGPGTRRYGHGAFRYIQARDLS